MNENNDYSKFNNRFRTNKSSCPENYVECEFFNTKSNCNCMKEDTPGNCVRKEKLIEDAMKLLNIDEKDAREVIEVFYENKEGGKA